MKKTSVFITTQKEFIHQYKDAPEEVSYLRYPHRHIAHIKVEVEVFHDDREIEFIMLKHQIDKLLSTMEATNKLSNNSCEMIANTILDYIHENYGTNRDIEIVVSEDGENGCVLRYRKEIAND